uniref:Uncharacterized protein n=1 Tax=Salix viminalis TaxID=40686 RepID=A0A6N2NAV4_SALVM
MKFYIKKKKKLKPPSSYKSPFTPQYSFLNFISKSRKKKVKNRKEATPISIHYALKPFSLSYPNLSSNFHHQFKCRT